MDKALRLLHSLDHEIRLLEHSVALVEWDQETYMPSAAIDERSEQIALLQGTLHEKIVSDGVARCLSDLGAGQEQQEGDPSLAEADRAFVREVFRQHSRHVKLPKKLVEEMARQASLTQAVWAKARADSDYASFAAAFTKLLDLVLQKAECIGYTQSKYDALLDEYEPYLKTDRLRSVFSSLQRDLKRLLDDIAGSGTVVRAEFLQRSFDIERQREFSRNLLRDLGYDFKDSRLDESAHPFTATLGDSDIRLTTRYVEDNLCAGIFGTIHEGGHGFYELGFGETLRGSILANGASLGIHESQSRFWENIVGRSRAFWHRFYPGLRDMFPQGLRDVDVDMFYRAVNRVQPSLIRVEADEVTYNLHIILRFNLELELVEGKLAVKDLPEAWREESTKLLGVAAEEDREGVLQDIHWSMGAIGYFPTYCLGNLYATQFAVAMRRDLPDMDEHIEKGRFERILAWQRENIHRYGSSYSAEDLARKVTGTGLSSDAFMQYLGAKCSDIYGI